MAAGFGREYDDVRDLVLVEEEWGLVGSRGKGAEVGIEVSGGEPHLWSRVVSFSVVGEGGGDSNCWL